MKFRKGRSGNPKGRPKGNVVMKVLAQDHSVEAVERLVHWMRQDDEPRVSVMASCAILDRAYGKPVQAVDVSEELQSIIVNVMRKK